MNTNAITLPTTEGRWEPIVRGKRGPKPTITGYLETFRAQGAWVTIPGVSRFVSVV